MGYLLVIIALGIASLVAWVFLGLAIGRRRSALAKTIFAVVAVVLTALAFLSTAPLFLVARGTGHATDMPRTDEGYDDVVVSGMSGQERARPVWRTSARNPDDRSALDKLEKNQAFDLQVRFAYMTSAKNCEDEVEAPVADEIATIVDEAVKLDLVLLVDDRYLTVAPDQSRTQIIASADIPTDACDIDVIEQNPVIKAATANFRVTTRDSRARAAAAVVIYRNGRPVDQIPMSVCVGTCANQRPIELDNDVGRYMSDLLRDAEAEPPTDASLYVFDLSSERSAGILTIRKDESNFEYAVWPIGDRGVKGVRATLNEPYSRVISETTDPGELANKGKELSSLIFNGALGRQARDKLESFLLATRRDTGRVPSLFVRISDRSQSTPLIFPVGLMAMKTVTDGSVFLGRHAQIVMPLPHQRYQRFDECSHTIYTVFPDAAIEEDALKKAHVAMSSKVADRWSQRAGANNRWASIGDFSEWLFEEPEIDEPAALFLLSHHQNGSIWMTGSPTVEAEALAGLRFNEPSWVVLNGCSSAGATPTGANFVQRFNESGAEAIIATHSEIPADMAGAYYRCLDEVLTKRKGSNYLLGAAHFDAVECLWNSSPPGEPAEDAATWGPNALKYVLLGNPNLRACPIEPET